jgi:conjugative transfer signal peptidase TraF
MIRILTVAAVAIGAAMACSYAAGIRCNTSPSMPMGIWKVSAAPTTVRRGDIVTLCLSADATALGLVRGYLTGGACPGDAELVIKTVAAVPGDQVEVTDDGIAVDDAAIPHSRAMLYDDQDRPMRAIAPGLYHVGERQVWVIGTADARSYDSRYFGPVPLGNLRGAARPLFVQQ